MFWVKSPLLNFSMTNMRIFVRDLGPLVTKRFKLKGTGRNSGIFLHIGYALVKIRFAYAGSNEVLQTEGLQKTKDL